MTKLDWFPMYFQRLKGSSAWKLNDYQFGWYMKLLFEAADSEMPGYLKACDPADLWLLAGAPSRLYFSQKGGPELVGRFFKREDGSPDRWFNSRLLQVIGEQSQKLKRKTKSELDASSLCLSLINSLELKKSINTLFQYYLALFERDGRYKLTASKESKCMARAVEFVSENGCSVDTWEVAAKEAMDNLRKSEFHWNGGYYDWIDHLFDSQDRFQKTLTMKVNANAGRNARSASEVAGSDEF